MRPQAAFAVPLALALACLAPRSWRAAAIRAALLVTLAAALLPVCWMTRNAVRFGHFALAAVGATTLYGANNAQALADPALCGSWASQRLALGAPALPRDETVYADRSLTAARTFARVKRASFVQASA